MALQAEEQMAFFNKSRTRAILDEVEARVSDPTQKDGATYTEDVFLPRKLAALKEMAGSGASPDDLMAWAKKELPAPYRPTDWEHRRRVWEYATVEGNAARLQNKAQDYLTRLYGMSSKDAWEKTRTAESAAQVISDTENALERYAADNSFELAAESAIRGFMGPAIVKAWESLGDLTTPQAQMKAREVQQAFMQEAMMYRQKRLSDAGWMGTIEEIFADVIPSLPRQLGAQVAGALVGGTLGGGAAMGLVSAADAKVLGAPQHQIRREAMKGTVLGVFGSLGERGVIAASMKFKGAMPSLMARFLGTGAVSVASEYGVAKATGEEYTLKDAVSSFLLEGAFASAETSPQAQRNAAWKAYSSGEEAKILDNRAASAAKMIEQAAGRPLTEQEFFGFYDAQSKVKSGRFRAEIMGNLATQIANERVAQQEAAQRLVDARAKFMAEREQRRQAERRGFGSLDEEAVANIGMQGGVPLETGGTALPMSEEELSQRLAAGTEQFEVEAAPAREAARQERARQLRAERGTEGPEYRAAEYRKALEEQFRAEREEERRMLDEAKKARVSAKAQQTLERMVDRAARLREQMLEAAGFEGEALPPPTTPPAPTVTREAPQGGVPPSGVTEADIEARVAGEGEPSGWVPPQGAGDMGETTTPTAPGETTAAPAAEGAEAAPLPPGKARLSMQETDVVGDVEDVGGKPSVRIAPYQLTAIRQTPEGVVFGEMYRGTAGDERASGTWWADSREAAKEYAESSGGKVYKAEVVLKRPFFAIDDAGRAELERLTGISEQDGLMETKEQWMSALEQAGYDGLVIDDTSETVDTHLTVVPFRDEGVRYTQAKRGLGGKKKAAAPAVAPTPPPAAPTEPVGIGKADVAQSLDSPLPASQGKNKEKLQKSRADQAVRLIKSLIGPMDRIDKMAVENMPGSIWIFSKGTEGKGIATWREFFENVRSRMRADHGDVDKKYPASKGKRENLAVHRAYDILDRVLGAPSAKAPSAPTPPSAPPAAPPPPVPPAPARGMGGARRGKKAAPPAAPAAEVATAQGQGKYSLMKDGIEGEAIDYRRVQNGNEYFEYAIGRVEEGAPLEVFRRSISNRGSYGGWRWETDVSKLKPAAPAATPPPAAAVPTPPKGVGRGKATPRKAMSLSQFVRNRGGINLGTGGLGGEFGQLRMKEGRTTGLVRTDGKGMDVERMLDEAVAEGYVPAETTPGDFLDMIAGDATRGQKIYSGKDGGLEAEVDRQERARLRAEQERYEEAKQEAEKRGETFPPPTPDTDAQPNDTNIESSAQSDPSDSLVDDLATPTASPVDGDDDASIAAQIDSQIADRQAQIGKLAAELGPESATDLRIINLEREIFELRLKRPYTPDLFSINDRDDSINSLARELAKMRRMDVPVDPFDKIEFIQKMQKVSDQLARKIADRAKFEMGTPKPRTDKGPVGGINKMDKAFRDFLDGKITADEFEKTYEKLRLDEEAARIVVQTRVRVTEPSRGVAQFNQRLATLLRDGKIDRNAYELTVWWTGKNSSMLEGLRLQTRPKSEATKGMAGFYSIAQRIITLLGSNGPVDTVVHEILHHTERMLPDPIRAAIKAEYVRALVKRMRDVKVELERANKSGDESAIKSAQDMVKFYGLISDIAATGLNHREAGEKFAEALRMVSENKLGRKHYYMLLPSEFWAVKGSEYISRRFAAKDSIWAQAAQWFREFVQKIKSMIGLRSDASVIRALDAVANGKVVTGDELGDPSLSYRGLGGRAKRRSGPIIFAAGPTDGDPRLGAGPRQSMNPSMRRIASWFSGTRTLEAGLGTDAHSVMAVEFDQKINNWANDLWGTDFPTRSVLNIDPAEVAAANPDLFHASPVCKNFSKAKIAAQIDPLDKASGEAVARVIREARPPVVTVENVPDYVDTIPYNEIVSALREQGYKFETVIVDAADYGGASTRKRMIIRAVLEGDIPPLPPKVPQGDWYSTVADLIPGAKPTTMRSRTPGEKHWELERLAVNNSLPKTSPNYIDLDKPIIVSGGSAAGDIAYARNAGRPAVVIKSTGSETMRILLPDPNGTEVVTLPDGTEKRFIAKRVTGRMMARLMGLPDSFQIPNNDSFAKKVLGNGMHTATTEAVIRPLLNRPEMKGRQMVGDDVVYSMAPEASVAPGPRKGLGRRPEGWRRSEIRDFLGESGGSLRGKAQGMGDMLYEKIKMAVARGREIRGTFSGTASKVISNVMGTRAERAGEQAVERDGFFYYRWNALIKGWEEPKNKGEELMRDTAHQTLAQTWNEGSRRLGVRMGREGPELMSQIGRGRTPPHDFSDYILDVFSDPDHPDRQVVAQYMADATNAAIRRGEIPAPKAKVVDGEVDDGMRTVEQAEAYMAKVANSLSPLKPTTGAEGHLASEVTRDWIIPDMIPANMVSNAARRRYGSKGFVPLQKPLLGLRLMSVIDNTSRIIGAQIEFGRGKTDWMDFLTAEQKTALMLGEKAEGELNKVALSWISQNMGELIGKNVLPALRDEYVKKSGGLIEAGVEFDQAMRTAFGRPFFGGSGRYPMTTTRGKMGAAYDLAATVVRGLDLTASSVLNTVELFLGSPTFDSVQGAPPGLNIPLGFLTAMKALPGSVADAFGDILGGQPFTGTGRQLLEQGRLAPYIITRGSSRFDSTWVKGIQRLHKALAFPNTLVNRIQSYQAARTLPFEGKMADFIAKWSGKNGYNQEVMAHTVAQRAGVTMEEARMWLEGDPNISPDRAEQIWKMAQTRAVSILSGEGIAPSESSAFIQQGAVQRLFTFWRWHDSYVRRNFGQLKSGLTGMATTNPLRGAAGAARFGSTLAGILANAVAAKLAYMFVFMSEEDREKEMEAYRENPAQYIADLGLTQLLAGPLGTIVRMAGESVVSTGAFLPGRIIKKGDALLDMIMGVVKQVAGDPDGQAQLMKGLENFWPAAKAVSNGEGAKEYAEIQRRESRPPAGLGRGMPPMPGFGPR